MVMKRGLENLCVHLYSLEDLIYVQGSQPSGCVHDLTYTNIHTYVYIL